jgi:hypothetical protein
MFSDLEYISIGSSPSGEDCVQVGDPDYGNKSMQECRRYVKLLQEKFPNPTSSNRFGIKAFPHDFGTYREVVVYYDPKDEKSTDFAFNVDANLPEYWE